MPKLTLSLLPASYAICKLPPEAQMPIWATQGDFWSVTKTKEELSLVCEASVVPAEVTYSGNWRMFKVKGPLDFSLTGILNSLTQPLAEAEVSIFALSTYDTDYLLVKQEQLEKALQALAEHFRLEPQ